jgi:TolB-like protein
MMKKTNLGLYLTIGFILLWVGSLHAQQSDILSLDETITQAAKAIEARLPARAKLAILNFSSSSEAFSDYVIEELTGVLVMNNKAMVIERRSLDLIRTEMNLQLSGNVSDDSAQAIGKQLGAQVIVSGSLTNMGDAYRFRIKVINVETARIENQVSYNMGNDQRVKFLLEGNPQSTPPVATGTSSGGAGGGTPTPAATVIAIEVTAKTSGTLYFQDKKLATLWDNETHTIPIEGPGTYSLKMVFADHEETRSVVINTRGITNVAFGVVYKISDTGPAGGLIFYDKGYYSDGWRYLEVAPASTEFTVEWGANSKNVNGTSTAWGYGNANTQAIVIALSGFGESGRAAQVCANLSYGGIKDWFLPSMDELDFIYKNLKQKGMGGFSNADYWSSSTSRTSRVAGNCSWAQNFSNGSRSDPWRANTLRVRAVRQF